MDLGNTVLNIVAPSLNFFSLCLFLPLYLIIKFLISIFAYFSPEDVAGKVVIVTGASSGTGEYIAYEYARRGACLVLAARREERLRQVADMCLKLGSPDAITVRADVSDINDCKRIVDSTILHFGKLHHLVSNAGIVSYCLFEEYEDMTKIKSLMDINFWGSVYVTRFAIPHLRSTRGKIVVMSSSSAWATPPGSSIYSASKAAMIALYETLRVEVGSDIHITMVTPGFVESEITKGKHLANGGEMSVDVDVRDAIIGIIPVGSTEACGKAIVNGACRGERHVTNPTWYNVIYWTKVFWPELMEWYGRIFMLGKMRDWMKGSLSKKSSDPSTVYSSPDIKTD